METAQSTVHRAAPAAGLALVCAAAACAKPTGFAQGISSVASHARMQIRQPFAAERRDASDPGVPGADLGISLDFFERSHPLEDR